MARLSALPDLPEDESRIRPEGRGRTRRRPFAADAAHSHLGESNGADEDSKKIAHYLDDGVPVEITELDQAGNIQRRWLHAPDHSVKALKLGTEKEGLFADSIRGWRKILSDAFLPVGFPHSVSADYLAYQTFDSLQAFFSTITSLLANRALLQGLGVGNADSTATFALLVTIVKDGTSRVATIAFAHRYGLTIEPECKRYRFLADLFNDSAFFLELLSPFLPGWAKIVGLSVGEALRAFCGVAAGASKAALSSHFALFDNLAELNAKEASQETAVGLCGLLVGSIVVRWVEGQWAVFGLMILLVFAHLWMNYLGVRCVKLRTLNRQRATILFRHYLETSRVLDTGRILDTEAVRKQESIVFWKPVMKNVFGNISATVSFAKSYCDAVGGGKNDVTVMEESSYTLFAWKRASGPMSIKIMLWDNASPLDAILAWFHAMEIAWAMDIPEGAPPPTHNQATSDDKTPANNGRIRGAILDSVLDRVPEWRNNKFVQKLKDAGWDTSSSSFETEAPIRLSRVARHHEREDGGEKKQQ